MGDLNNDSNVGTWPVYFGDKPPSNGQFHDPHFQRAIADAYFGYHTETVRQKMLDHEAIFKTQVYELHRLYRVQRELMDDLKMNELQKQALETSMSSCSASQRPDAQRRLTSLPFPLSSSSSAQPAVVGAKDFHSIPYFLNGRHPQNCLVSPSNPSSSKNCEVEILECRPSIARRKFDLELQADEYIDVEEPKCRSDKPPGMSHYLSNGSCEVPSSSSTKMFLSRSNKIDSLGDEARKNKSENGLADLNEQIQTQGPNSSPLNFVGCNTSVLLNQQLCSKSQLQTAPWDSMPLSQFGRDASSSRNLSMAHRENGREWSHILNSARSKGQTTVFSQNLFPKNIDFFNKDRNASYLQTNQMKAEHWKERSEGGPKHSGSNLFNRLSNPHLEKSFTTNKAPWEKSGNCVTQKLGTAETYPFFNSTGTLPQSLQSSSKSAQALGESWRINSAGGVNAAYQDGFYKGSCSGSGPAWRTTIGYNYLNHSSDAYATSGASICQNGSVKFKGLTSVDATSAKGVDLNITSVADKYDYDDRPNQDHVAHFPWLKSSKDLRNGNWTVQSSNGCVLRQNTGSVSSACHMAMNATTGKMITGVSIFGDSHLSKGSLSCRSSLSKEEEMENDGRVRDFDMNLPCEYDEKDTETPAVSGRSLIDLNMSLADNDTVMEIPTPCSHPEKTIRGFDLEASSDIEAYTIQQKQQKSENSDGSLVTVAAEAIIGISSSRKRNPAGVTPPDVLKWFVDVVSSCPDDADKALADKSEEEIDSVDYFEYMTLQLTETKEDEYLPEYPKPPEPEEETGAGLYTTRTRKGQARRGRPRRDFQRDILPGLTSLARHEVTEDIQTLGGLMRATGHSWQYSITRRAGPRRGRPRLTPVQPPNPLSTQNLSSPSCSPLPPKKLPSPFCSPSPPKRKTPTPKEIMNMEDDHGNLTGWGETTRRPRRQPRRQRFSTASVIQHIT